MSPSKKTGVLVGALLPVLISFQIYKRIITYLLFPFKNQQVFLGFQKNMERILMDRQGQKYHGRQLEALDGRCWTSS